MGTALVTGASSGLGKELALLFAKDKHDVVLVARSVSRLEEVAKQVRALGVTAHVVGADLGSPRGPAEVEERCAGLTIDFLVNNAGYGSNGAFLEQDRERELSMIDLNDRALVDLSYRFARQMRSRRTGKILNIASVAGFQAGPYMATYYATKAFVISFSEALAFELAAHGITVTCHCPGATATEFGAIAGNDKSRLFKRSKIAGAPETAQHAYDAMMKGEVLAIHGAKNWLMVWSQRLGPRSLPVKIAAGLNKAEE